MQLQPVTSGHYVRGA